MSKRHLILNIVSTEDENKKQKVDDTPVVDYSAMKVSELKEECKAKGLKVSGSKAELITRLSTTTPSERGKPAEERKKMINAGVNQADIDNTEAKAVRKKLKKAVKKLASLVDDNWHDGWEGQSEQARKWFDVLAGPAQAVFNLAVTQHFAFERCQDILMEMSDSKADIEAIPMRCDLYGCDDIINLVTEDGESWEIEGSKIMGVLWRLFLASAAENGVSDELMFRWIKNADDNGETITDDQDDETVTDLIQEKFQNGATRLKNLFKNTNWKTLPNLVRKHNMRKIHDSRYDDDDDEYDAELLW